MGSGTTSVCTALAHAGGIGRHPTLTNQQRKATRHRSRKRERGHSWNVVTLSRWAYHAREVSSAAYDAGA
jgi:hypothetical protein